MDCLCASTWASRDAIAHVSWYSLAQEIWTVNFELASMMSVRARQRGPPVVSCAVSPSSALLHLLHLLGRAMPSFILSMHVISLALQSQQKTRARVWASKHSPQTLA